jgi:tetratricopeptide (TPR) repeat protein
LVLAIIGIGVGTTTAVAQEVAGCGSLVNAFGPFDYRDPLARQQSLQVVETHHFTPDVESLKRGKTSSAAIDDLNYTLRAFPNHHRALNSVVRYALQGGKFPKDSSIPSADCYFKRAIAFRPDDEIVRMIYANLLTKYGQQDDARAQYEEALSLAPDSVEVNYNAGLFFVSQGDILRAKQLAKIAYAGGYPLPGLNKKIAEAESKGRP